MTALGEGTQRGTRQKPIEGRKALWSVLRRERHCASWRITYPAFLVLYNENKPNSPALVLSAFLVERGQASAVLLQAVNEVPVLDNSQPLRHHGPDLLCHGVGQQPGGGRRAVAVAMQHEGFEGRGAERAGSSHRRLEDAVDAVLVVVVVVLRVPVVGVPERPVELAAELAVLGGEAAYQARPHAAQVRRRRGRRGRGR